MKKSTFTITLFAAFLFFTLQSQNILGQRQKSQVSKQIQFKKGKTDNNQLITPSEPMGQAGQQQTPRALSVLKKDQLATDKTAANDELIQKLRKKCATVEVNDRYRQLYPGMGSVDDFEKWMSSEIEIRKRNGAGQRTQAEIFTIPVVVHVVHNGEEVGVGDNLSQAQIVSQIKVLNEDFRRMNADASQTPSFFVGVAADIEIEFRLATVDPDGVPLSEPGIHRWQAPSAGPWLSEDIDETIKPVTIWDPERYLNIWVIDLGGDILGFSTFPTASGLPGLNFTPPPAETEGVVLMNLAFGSNFTGDGTFNLLQGNNRGRTCTHEVGHFLGLRHTWGDGDCSADDFVDDTPLTAEENFVAPPNCGQGINSCDEGPGDLPDMVQNYMDFSFDGCMNLFTQGQKDRVRTVLENSPRRMELTTSTAADPTDPDAVFPFFSISSERICQGGTATFTDASEAGSNTTVTGWSWNFDVTGIGGATPATETTQGPHVVQFDVPGVYEISLQVTGANAATNLVSKTITVESSEATGTFPDTEGFEENFPPDNWGILNEGFISWLQVSLGARGSENSTFINNFSNNLTGLTNITLTTPTYDLSGATDAFLYFDVAYAGFIDESNGGEVIYDDLALVYSTNCGIDFMELDVLTGMELESDVPLADVFIPTSPDQWKNIQINLADFPGIIGQESIIFGFSNRGNFGNLLFIDNVAISSVVDQLPSVLNPLEDFTIFVNSADSVIDLSGVFDDEDNDNALITVEVIGNSNPSLVSTSIIGSDLTLGFTPDVLGSAVITLEATSNGLTIKDDFVVRVISDFDVIFGQNQLTGVGIVNSGFSDLSGVIQNADDFTIPEGAVYTIHEVFAPGFFAAGSSEPPASLTLQFFEDDNGQPGNQIFIENSDFAGALSLADTAFLFPLSTPLELMAGTYWVSIYPEMNSTTGQWNWFEANSDNGAAFHLIDASNLFGAGLTDWTPSTNIINRKSDLAFELRGEISGEIPPLAPSGLVATAFLDAQVNLSWQDNSDNEIGFKVWRADVETGPYVEVGEVPLDVTMFTDNTVSSENACEIYFYRVTATKSPADSRPSNTAAAAVTKPTIPEFTDYVQDFEGDFPPMGWEVLNFANGDIGWEQAAAGFGENSQSSASIDNFNNDLTTQALIILATPAFDVSSLSSLFLSFDVAYAGFADTNGDLFDSLFVAFSVDCGLSYSILTTLNGEDLATAASTQSQFVPAGDSEWQNITVDISAVIEEDSANNVRFALVNIPSFAQTMYIDNFSLSESLIIAAPTNLTGLSEDGTQVVLSWTDNATNELGYVVERSENNQDNFVVVAELGSNVTNFTDEGLTEEVTYFYRVKAVNGVSESDYSNVVEVFAEPVGLSEALLRAITVFPNPSKGLLHVSIDGYSAEEIEINIFDPLGKVLNTNNYQVVSNSSGVSIDLSGQSGGIYFLHVKTAEGFAAKRLIKEN